MKVHGENGDCIPNQDYKDIYTEYKYYQNAQELDLDTGGKEEVPYTSSDQILEDNRNGNEQEEEKRSEEVEEEEKEEPSTSTNNTSDHTYSNPNPLLNLDGTIKSKFILIDYYFLHLFISFNLINIYFIMRLNKCYFISEIHKWRCRLCNNMAEFDNRADFYKHNMRFHSQITQTGGTESDVLQEEPWTDANPAPWTDNDGLREAYEINRPLILQNHREQGTKKT